MEAHNKMPEPTRTRLGTEYLKAINLIKKDLQKDMRSLMYGAIAGAGLIVAGLGIPVYHMIKGEREMPIEHSSYALMLAGLGAAIGGTSTGKLANGRGILSQIEQLEEEVIKINTTPKTE